MNLKKKCMLVSPWVHMPLLLLRKLEKLKTIYRSHKMSITLSRLMFQCYEKKKSLKSHKTETEGKKNGTSEVLVLRLFIHFISGILCLDAAKQSFFFL